MLRFSALFAAGVWLFHRSPELPGMAVLASAIALLLILVRWPRSRIAAAVLGGFVWSHAYALVTLPAFLPGDHQVLELRLSGQVVSLPELKNGRSRFVFAVDHVETRSGSINGRWRVRVSWHQPPILQVGQVWRLPVRLRAAHGYASPGAWDYEAWLYWQGIRYTAYVLPQSGPALLDSGKCCVLDRLRSAAAQRIDALELSEFSRGVLRAITIGDTAALSAADKALFRVTGTSHLMAISGLHISLVAGLGLIGVTWLWRRLPALVAVVPARVAGALAGVAVAAVYAALAGMALPTQRALIMLLVLASGLCLRREISIVHALAVALLGVLLWHPPSILAAGLWLSFGAVLAIVAVIRSAGQVGRWRHAVRLQLAISLALWPLLSAFGLPVSLISPLVNLLLVPLFGLCVVPLGLLGTLLLFVHEPLGAWVLPNLGILLDWVRRLLVLVASWPLPSLAAPAPGPVALVLALSGVALLLSPPGLPFRWLGIPVFLAVLLPIEPDLPEGDFVVHVLDVGQGLSVVVRTRGRTLVFDTGPQYRSGFDTASAVLAPFLAERAVRRIDRLILSHGDSDHAGGVAQLSRLIDIAGIQSGEPGRVDIAAEPCAGGQRWRWNRVDFELLHPAEDTHYVGNNASCVLKVSNAAGALLLTGDIERRVERRLVARMPERLRSQVVTAPHHGSASSSGGRFIAASGADFVVYSAGWNNRYGFPKDEVTRRWDDSGAIGLNTASLGTISITFSAERGILAPKAHRVEAKRFWSHDTGSAGQPLAVSSADQSPSDGDG